MFGLQTTAPYGIWIGILNKIEQEGIKRQRNLNQDIASIISQVEESLMDHLHSSITDFLKLGENARIISLIICKCEIKI